MESLKLGFFEIATMNFSNETLVPAMTSPVGFIWQFLVGGGL